MSTGPLNLDWSFSPTLNLQKFNIILQELKTSLGKMGGDIKLIDESKIIAAFQKVDREAGKTGQTIKDSFAKGAEGANKIDSGLKLVENRLKSTSSLSEKAFNFANISQSLGAIGSSMSQLSSSTVAIDTGLRNVGTLGVKNWKEFEGMMDGFVKRGADASIVTKSLYDAISAGTVKSAGGIADLKGAQEFLGSAAKLAKAGLVDMTVTTDALTTVLNSYGATAQEAGKYSDQLFGAVKLGKTTVAELAPSLYNVVPVAKQAGISFDQVAAGLATITKSGVPTAEATTQLRTLITELIKPAGNLDLAMKKAGVSLESIKAEGLQSSLVKLNDTFKDMGIISSQAFSSIVALGGFNAMNLVDSTGAKVALDDLQYIQTSAVGAVDEAYSLAADSIESRSKRLWGSIQSGINSAMSFVGPGLTSIMNVMPQLSSTMTAFAAIKFLNPVQGIKSLYSSMLLLGSKSTAIFQSISSGASVMGAQLARGAKAWQLATTFNPGGVKAQIQNIITAVSAMIPAFGGVAVAEGTAAASATTMWAAIGGPITVIVAGIAVLVGALFGISAIMGSLRKKSAEENLKLVESEISKNDSLKQTYESQLQIEEQKLKKSQELTAKYAIDQLAKPAGAGDSAAKQTLLELEQTYPGVIKAGMSYKEAMKAIGDEQERAAQKIVKYEASLYDLEEAQTKLTIKKDNLNAQKEAEDITKLMTKSTQGWFDSAVSWLTGSSAAEQKAVDAMNSFKQGIYTATTDNDLKEKVVDFQLAIWQDPRFSSIPEEDKIKMVNSIKKMGEDQGKALKSAMESVKKYGGKISDYLPKVTEEDAGVFGKAFAWISNTVMGALQPLMDILKGAGMYFGEFIEWISKLAASAAWSAIQSVSSALASSFRFIYDAMVSLTLYIKDKALGAWETLLNVFKSIPGASKFIETSMQFVKSAFNGVVGVVTKAWETIKGIYTTVVDFFALLGKKGRGDEEVKNEKLTNAQIDKAYKRRLNSIKSFISNVKDANAEEIKVNYDKQAEYLKWIKENKKITEKEYADWSLKLQNAMNDAVKVLNLGTSKEEQRQSLFAKFQELFDNAADMSYNTRKDTATSLLKLSDAAIRSRIVSEKEMAELTIKARKLIRSVSGGGPGDSEQAQKDYDEYAKVQNELSKKRLDVAQKQIEDEYLAEKVKLDDSYKKKIIDYNKRITDYQKEIEKSKDSKLIEDRKNAIEGIKQLMNYEEAENNTALEELYKKLAEKRIKEIDKNSKDELSALKDKESALRDLIESMGNNISMQSFLASQQYQTDIVYKETDNRISKILSEQEAYKALSTQIMKYDLILKQATNGDITLSADELENYKKKLTETQSALQAYINSENLSNEQIIALKLNNQQKIAVLQKQQIYDLAEFEISLIKDSSKQKYEYDLLLATQNYEEKLSKAKGILKDEMQAFLEFQKEKLAIEQQYALRSQSVWTTGLTTIANSFSNSMSELTFNIDDTQQKESLKKIDEEEKAMSQSLAARTTEYEDYLSKLSELDKQRAEQSANIAEQMNEQMLAAIKKSLADAQNNIQQSLNANLENYKTYAASTATIEKQISDLQMQSKNDDEQNSHVYAQKINNLSEQKAEVASESEKIIQAAYAQTGLIAGLVFGQMLADHKSFAKSSVLASLSAVQALVPIFIVEILGKEFATKSLAGIATAGLLTGLMVAALSAAQAGVSSMKFRHGVVDLQGPGTTTSDSISARLSKRESVIPAEGTITNLPELRWLVKNKDNMLNYYIDEEPERLKEAFYHIAEAKDLMKMGPVINMLIEDRNKDTVAEVRKMRYENRILNKKIEILTKEVKEGYIRRRETFEHNINLELNDTELLSRADHKKLTSVRRG